MPKFNVTIEETCSQTFEVEAENAERASEIAREKYDNSEFVLSPGELTYKQMQVMDETKEVVIDWEEF